MPPALAPRDREQLERLVSLAADVLGDAVEGAYLFGSAVLGGLRPDSDLDALVVVRRPTSQAERRRLVARLLEISGRSTSDGQERRLELTVVAVPDVRPWRYPPRFDFQYGDWLRREFESGELEPWQTRTSPDLATLITMVHLADSPLLGPAPAAVLDPVPCEDLVRAQLDGLDALLADLEWDTRNVILTLARSWSTIATGEIRSKDAAATWALARLPEELRGVLAHARAVYLGSEVERWDGLEALVRPHVGHVLGRIRAEPEAQRVQ